MIIFGTAPTRPAPSRRLTGRDVRDEASAQAYYAQLLADVEREGGYQPRTGPHGADGKPLRNPTLLRTAIALRVREAKKVRALSDPTLNRAVMDTDPAMAAHGTGLLAGWMMNSAGVMFRPRPPGVRATASTRRQPARSRMSPAERTRRSRELVDRVRALQAKRQPAARRYTDAERAVITARLRASLDERRAAQARAERRLLLTGGTHILR